MRFWVVSYAFVFRAYPDVDHVVPLVWRLLEEGEEVHAVISPGYDVGRDYRLEFVRRYPRFRLHELRPTGRDGGRRRSLVARATLRGSLPHALWFVARNRVRVVGVEWGYGLPSGYEKLRSPRGLAAVARSVAGSIVRGSEPRQVRTNFIVAARLLRRQVVCLPHGLSIKLGLASAGGDYAEGSHDWRDRNRFAAYVLNTEHHRQWFLDRAMGDPAVMQTWGSLRWAPEWFELNRKLAPTFSWPPDPAGAPERRTKVIFMVPKWGNLVDHEATLELVRDLARLECVSLAIKGHPRPEDGSRDPLRADPSIDWGCIHDLTGVDSVSVIAAADVVIDVGSSIGIEAVMQRKVLLNPSYIHDFRTLFDAVSGSCVVAHSADEVAGYLRRHAAGSPHRVDDAAYRELLRRGVYGSRPEPFDVIGNYSKRLRAMAHAGSPSGQQA